MIIFEYEDYKKYVRARLEEMPKKGHGQFRKMAKFLATNSVSISQIFRGDRDLSVEQACALNEFFGHRELESEYFVTLVELERAGTHSLKQMRLKRLRDLRDRAGNLKERLRQEKELSHEVRSEFYSHWYYSGIRLLSSIEKMQTPNAISDYFALPLPKVTEVLEFLVQNGLCVEQGGRYRMGPASTHLESNSSLVGRHHANWRVVTLGKLDDISPQELCLTLPCTLSEKAFAQIRQLLVDAIAKITDEIDQAPCHQLACLNVDWRLIKSHSST